MGFQSTVAAQQGSGVAGELAYTGPVRAKPYILNSADAANNVVGRAFWNAATEGQARAGSGGAVNAVFAGILANPKVYPLLGSSTDPLAASMLVANGVAAEFVTMGEIFVNLDAAFAVGSLVYADDTTGILGSVAPRASFTGQTSTTTLTVSAFVAGSAPLGIGSAVTGVGVLPNTVITALGTGVGGDGTYTINNSQTVGPVAMTAAAIAPSGKTFLPRTVIDQFAGAAAGLGVIKLTD